MWDAASAWLDERCHVRAQDSNQRNTGPPAAECANLTTRPRGQPPQKYIFAQSFRKSFLSNISLLASQQVQHSFFFLRKISPELTSAANPPLFAEEDWP